MTLDEAIKHCEEVADGLTEQGKCAECAAEHRQLAEWLKELKQLREQTQWISVSEKMPQEREWIGTKQFGTTISDEVYVTFETPKGERFTRHLSFQNGELSPMEQSTIDAFFKGSTPVAWMPLPEPYRAESEV